MYSLYATTIVCQQHIAIKLYSALLLYIFHTSRCQTRTRIEQRRKVLSYISILDIFNHKYPK